MPEYFVWVTRKSEVRVKVVAETADRAKDMAINPETYNTGEVLSDVTTVRDIERTQ
jgi:hypothetical protein